MSSLFFLSILFLSFFFCAFVVTIRFADKRFEEQAMIKCMIEESCTDHLPEKDLNLLE